MLDVGLEVDVERGELAYDEVAFSVARQQGKTTLLPPWELVGLVVDPMLLAALGLSLAYPQRALYTAQTGKAAEKKFRDDQLPTLERHARRLRMGRPRMSQGSMTVPFPYGRLYVSAPNDDAGRGGQLDRAIVDEARQLDGEVESGIDPAMATRPSSQKVLTSNVGRLPWWRAKIGAARAAVERGDRHGVALFDWGAGRDDDPADPATWERALPSWGCRTPAGLPMVRPDYLARQYVAALAKGAEGLDTFREEYLNVELDGPESRTLDLAAWGAGAVPDALAPPSGLVVTAEVAPDRSRSALVLAAPVGHLVHVELAATGPGVSWVAPALLELVGRSGRARLDAYGPAGNVAADVSPRLGDRLELAGTADVSRACAQFVDLLAASRLRHRAQPELDAAVAGARARTYGRDAWLWDRATTDPAVVALSLAADAASRPPGPLPMVSRAR